MKDMTIAKATAAGLLAIGLLGYALAKDDEGGTASGFGSQTTGALANSKLAGAIGGTTWNWDAPNERITFGKDGLVRHPGWEERGVVTSWQVIDEHTVLLTIEKGRRMDRYAILVFNADFTEYAGYNFHGAGKITPCKQIRS